MRYEKICVNYNFCRYVFSACEKQTENITDTTAENYIETPAPQTQIDHAEEFGGITFGMTQDEVISIVGKKPDYIIKDDGYSFTLNTISYFDQEHFNLNTSEVTYCFKKDTNALCKIVYDYHYDESEQEQFLNDYDVIKEEILRRYPEEIWIDSYNYENDEDPALLIYTENREVFLCAYPDILDIGVMIEEHHPENDTSE